MQDAGAVGGCGVFFGGLAQVALAVQAVVGGRHAVAVFAVAVDVELKESPVLLLVGVSHPFGHHLVLMLLDQAALAAEELAGAGDRLGSARFEQLDALVPTLSQSSDLLGMAAQVV